MLCSVSSKNDCKFVPIKLLSYLTLTSLTYLFLAFLFGLLEVGSLLHLVLISLLEECRVEIGRVEVWLSLVDKVAISSCLERLTIFPPMSISSSSSIHLFRKYSNIQFFTFTIFKVINDDYIITIQRIQN